MKLVMTTNLGLADAKRLDIEAGREGETVDVDGAAAEELVKRGWAVAAVGKPAPAPKPDPIKPSDTKGTAGNA